MKQLHKDMTIQDFIEWCKENPHKFFSELTEEQQSICNIFANAVDVTQDFLPSPTNSTDWLSMCDYFIKSYGEEVLSDMQQYYNDNKSDIS